MRYYVVAVRDRAADVFAQPMCVASKGAAIRSFSDEINRADANNMLYKHPNDFDLYLLCEFDDANGQFVEMGDGPRQMAIGKDVAVREGNPNV